MNDADRIKEWQRYYRALHTDAAKFALFAQLKQGDDADLEALRLLIAEWVKE